MAAAASAGHGPPTKMNAVEIIQDVIYYGGGLGGLATLSWAVVSKVWGVKALDSQLEGILKSPKLSPEARQQVLQIRADLPSVGKTLKQPGVKTAIAFLVAMVGISSGATMALSALLFGFNPPDWFVYVAVGVELSGAGMVLVFDHSDTRAAAAKLAAETKVEEERKKAEEMRIAAERARPKHSPIKLTQNDDKEYVWGKD